MTGNAALALSLGAVLLAASCSDGATKPTASSTAASEPTDNQGDGNVNILNFTFAPKPVRVAKGTTVRWLNQDDAVHSVVASDRTLFVSGLMAQGDDFTFVAAAAGTISYICGVHQYMTGEIVVS